MMASPIFRSFWMTLALHLRFGRHYLKQTEVLSWFGHAPGRTWS